MEYNEVLDDLLLGLRAQGLQAVGLTRKGVGPVKKGDTFDVVVRNTGGEIAKFVGIAGEEGKITLAAVEETK